MVIGECYELESMQEGRIRIYPAAEDHPFENLGHGEIIGKPEWMARDIEDFMSGIQSHVSA